MPVTQDKPAPYAPATATLNIVERYRERGIPAPINVESLLRTGLVTESLAPRTVYTLQVLDLIDDAGNPTDTLTGIQRAPTGEYQAYLAEWVRKAYADVLSFIDPATATEQDVHDAFRLYSPAGQRDRMVTLFLGLSRGAGLAPEKAAGAGTGTPRKKAATAAKKPRIDKPQAQASTEKDAQSSDGAGAGQTVSTAYMEALLAKFPTFDPAWPDPIKAKWFEGFEQFMKGAAPK